MSFFKIYPGMRMKRWIFLLILSAIVLAIAMRGCAGITLKEFKLVIIPEAFMMDVAHRVQSWRFVDFLLLILGLWGLYLAIGRIIRNTQIYYAPEKDDRALPSFLRRNQLRKGPRIVAFGGGTGLPALLHGLKEFTSNITAIVTVMDDGGSSGRLRREMHVLPPGDIRNCLVALADVEPLMSELFQHRFKGKSALTGHSFGNLLIAALSDVTGDFGQAVKESSKILAIRGQVLPVTLENVSLHARLVGGKLVKGESSITNWKAKVDRVFLKPDNCKPSPEALEAISKAQAIIMGPGSLYTSILPNLLVPGIADAIARASAVKIYVCNIMTQPGETTGYSASEHVRKIIEHTGRKLMDYVVVNSEKIPEALLKKYALDGAYPVDETESELKKLGVSVIKAKVLAEGDYVRHDPLKLGRTIMKQVII